MSSDDQRKAYLQAMGISLWQPRTDMFADAPATSVTVESSTPVPVSMSSIPSASWEELRAQVSDCRACALAESRTQTVFGVGNPQADWLIIGEAPGRDEDTQGEPFVGAAGQLLNEMLFALGLKREQVFIANILKCQPPNNRDPQAEEVQQCIGYLKQQIQLIRPKIILSVGRISAQNLLQSETPVGKLRGQVHRFGEQDIPLVVTYHPAYLLRSPLEKRKAWDDLQLAKAAMLEQA